MSKTAKIIKVVEIKDNETGEVAYYELGSRIDSTHLERREPEKPKPTRKYRQRSKFDMNITTADVVKAKEKLQKLAWQHKLDTIERDRYENLCQGIKVEELSVGEKDKIITLYKDVGKRLNG